MNTIRKGHGKTRDKTYIRTFRIDKETASTLPHEHMSSPLSPNININSENALLYLPTPSHSHSESYIPRTPSPPGSYHSPSICNPFHRLPLSPMSKSAIFSTDISKHTGGPGPYPDKYELGSTNKLLDTWRLCCRALYYFRTEWVLPNILQGYTAQLFSMATNDRPLGSLEEAECEANHYGSVVGALCAYCAELVDYVPNDEYLIRAAHPEPGVLPRRLLMQEDEAICQPSPTPSNTTAAVLLQ